ncbi:MAG: CDGSH iron-sulfur domain-containing protein [Planctomycetota bacterium]|nr:CDGSH iron-sulfur domain-containing protein [Planctomycetota bacterium]
MADISVFDNGPLLIKGDVTLKDGDGKEYDLEGKESIALCRCGASQNKPFCDGSHKGGFESSCRA